MPAGSRRGRRCGGTLRFSAALLLEWAGESSPRHRGRISRIRIIDARHGICRRVQFVKTGGEAGGDRPALAGVHDGDQ